MEFPIEKSVLVGLRLAQQRRQTRDAIVLRRRFRPADFSRRRQEIPKSPNKIAHLSRLILAGHRTIVGTRIPPSYKSRLVPRNGPELWKNFGSTPPSLCAPLSLEKKTIVFSSIFNSFNLLMNWPMSLSIRLIIAVLLLSTWDHASLAEVALVSTA